MPLLAINSYWSILKIRLSNKIKSREEKKINWLPESTVLKIVIRVFLMEKYPNLDNMDNKAGKGIICSKCRPLAASRKSNKKIAV